jgi:uncharacterized protein
MTQTNYAVIDADTHFHEPLDLFQRYIDPGYRAQCPSFEMDAEGMIKLRWPHEANEKKTPPRLKQMPSMKAILENPAGFDPTARLKLMDQEEVAIHVIYPTHGLRFSRSVPDPGLAGAICRAYNRWVSEFCSHNPSRFKGVALIPINHPEVALEELRFAREDLGLPIAFLNPTPVPGLNWHHESLDPVWAALTDLDMIATFHSGTAAITNIVGIDRYELYTMNSLCSHVVEGMLCLMDMILGGVLERFPKLRVGLVETYVAWLPGWLALMDDLQPRHLGWMNLKNPLSLLPSEYFKRQCYITAFPDDPMLDSVIDVVGDDYIAVSSDFPHMNSRRDMVATFKRLHGDLPEESQRKILSTNMLRVLGVDAGSAKSLAVEEHVVGTSVPS